MLIKMESYSVLFLLLVLVTVFKQGSALLCHRCYSSMPGCGASINWRMFPWRDCGDSDFCVKVIEKRNGETHYIRECESVLLKSTRHRLKMPLLKRHNYCLPGRKNDPYNPEDLEDKDTTYCFCNEYWGCNSAGKQRTNQFLFGFLCSSVLLFTHNVL